jgi:[CysO sulfur-carrier protein]-S-L-cysteine hydrolase
MPPGHASPTLTLRSELVAAMIAHACHDHPIEACGLLAGHTEAELHIPMQNAARSAAFFRFSMREARDVWRDLTLAGMSPLALYHSHTGSPAILSRSDIEFGTLAGAHSIVISTAVLEHPDIRVYRIVGRRAIPVPLTVSG